MPIKATQLGDVLQAVITKSMITIAQRANETQIGIDAFVDSQTGVSADGLAALLFGGESTVAGAAVTSFEASILKAIASAINGAWQGGGDEWLRDNVKPAELLTWHTSGSVKSCPDCAARDGQQRTYDEWANVGLPKSGFSICGGYCRCYITPDGPAKK